jgi:hypothetical protein
MEVERFAKKASDWETTQTKRTVLRHMHAELAAAPRLDGPVGIVSRVRRGNFELFLVKQNGDYRSLGTFSSHTLERLQERMDRICFKFACDSIHLTDSKTRAFVKKAIAFATAPTVSPEQIRVQVQKVRNRLGNARAWLFFKRFLSIKKSMQKAVNEALSNSHALPETKRKAE